MKEEFETINAVRLRGVSVSLIVGCAVSFVALIIISEWTLGVKIIANFSPTDSSMKFNTSVIFLMFGLSLIFHQLKNANFHRVAAAMTIFGMIVAALTLSQYMTGVNLGIDEIIFRDNPSPDITSSPGRMSPLVAVNFLLSGAALLLFRMTTGRQSRPSDYFAVLGLFVPVIVALGYLFSASPLYSFRTVTGVALFSAILFIILLTGVLAVRSERSIAAVFLSATSGGQLMRFLLPSSVLTLILLYWLSVQAARGGYISEEMVVPLGLIACGTVITFLIWRTAKLLYDVEQRQMQTLAELQMAYQTAEEANRAKDEFISVVSHELRTPLSSILGWLQIMRKNPTEENIRRGLEVVKRQSETQLQLVEDLLDTSRMITGKMRLEIEALNLENVIAESIETVRPAAEAKNISLVFEKQPDLKPLFGDADRLLQVFWNVLSNAVKFTPNDGAIVIGVHQKESNVEVKISDTGEGIDAELLPFVFERFRQSSHSTSRRSGGLGLGLALVRSIIELHGGKVTAASEGSGKGATFTIRLPLRENN